MLADIRDQLPTIVGVALLVLLVLVIAFIELRTRRRFRRFFSGRECMPADEWAGRYFPDLSEADQNHAIGIAAAVAPCLYTETTTLRPSDTIFKDYFPCGPLSFMGGNSEWEEFTSALTEYIVAYSSSPLDDEVLEHLPKEWTTLDNLIRSVIPLCDKTPLAAEPT
jgi:hypothetical protein